MLVNRPEETLMDYLQPVSIALYHYLKQPSSKGAVLLAVNEMEKNYSAPIHSWLYGSFYQFFRTRLMDIHQLKERLQDKETDCASLLCEFFEKGAWEQTSANTILMLQCLEKLSNNFESPHPSYWSKKSLMQVSIFLRKEVNQYKNLENRWLEKQKHERNQQLQNIVWPHIADRAKQIVNSIDYIHTKSYAPNNIKKISQHPQYGDIFFKLEKLLYKKPVLSASVFLEKHAMSHKTLPFTAILKTHFRDPTTQNHYRQIIKNLFSRNLLTRAFDEFNFSIIDQQDLDRLSSELNFLLSSIKIKEKNLELTKESKATVQSWENKIIILACHNLLDPHTGNIKSNILSSLGLSASLSAKDSFDLISAYVGRINQDCMFLSKEIIDKNQEQFFSVCSFVSKNYGNWINDFLQQEKNTSSKDNLYWTFAGVGLIISTTSIGYLLFNKPSSNNQPDATKASNQLNNKYIS